MNIIDHGEWLPYKPAKIPEAAPPNALFASRKSDNVDWYDYVNSGENFGSDTVKFAAIMRDGIGYIVGPAAYDPTLLFPANHIVAEITDYTGNDPFADFTNKVYDPVNGTFTDQPAQKAVPTATEEKILSALDAILTRIEKLENN